MSMNNTIVDKDLRMCHCYWIVTFFLTQSKSISFLDTKYKSIKLSDFRRTQSKHLVKHLPTKNISNPLNILWCVDLLVLIVIIYAVYTNTLKSLPYKESPQFKFRVNGRLHIAKVSIDDSFKSIMTNTNSKQ